VKTPTRGGEMLWLKASFSSPPRPFLPSYIIQAARVRDQKNSHQK
jgi:hypothetical protein